MPNWVFRPIPARPSRASTSDIAIFSPGINSLTLSVSTACSVSFTKQANKIVSVSDASVVSIIKLALRKLTVALTNAATITKQANRSVPSVSSSNTVSLVKQPQKIVSANDASVASIVTQIIRALTVSVTSTATATLARRANKILSVSSANVATITRRVAKLFSRSTAAVVTLIKSARTSLFAASLISDTTLNNGLLAAWKFEESSGNRSDATGTGHTLVPAGAVTRASGKVGYAAEFGHTTTDYFDAALSGDLAASSGDFYLALWFYTDALSDDHTIFYYGVPGDVFEYRAVFSDDTIIFQVNSLGDSIQTPITPGEWHLLEFWYDSIGEQINLAVDTGQDSVRVSFIITVPGATLRVGDRMPWDGGPIVKLDAMAIWNRVLTSNERAALWNDGLGRELPHLQSVFLTKQPNKVVSAITKIARVVGTDSFTDPDNTLLSAHTPNEGRSWTGADSNYKIISNQLTNKGTGLVHAVWPAFGTEVEFSVNVVQLCPGTGVAVSIMIRHQNAANYWELFYDVGNGWQLDKVVGGADNFVGSPMTGTTGTIKLKATGNTIVATSPDGSTRTAFDSALNTMTDVAVILRGDLTTPSIIDNAQVTVFNYSITKQVNKIVSTVSTANVPTVTRIKVKLLTIATVATSAVVSLTKQVNKKVGVSILSATGTTSIALTIKKTIASLTATETPTVNALKVVLRSITTATANVVSLSRLVQKIFSLATANSVTITKRLSKSFSLSTANAATVTKQANKNLAPLSSTSVATLAKQANKIFSVASSSVVTLQRLVAKIFSLATTSVTTVTKQANKFISPMVATASPFLSKLIGKPLPIVAASTTVTLQKATARTFSVNASGTPSLRILVPRVISVVTNGVATLTAFVTRILKMPFFIRILDSGARKPKLDASGEQSAKLDADGKDKSKDVG